MEEEDFGDIAGLGDGNFTPREDLVTQLTSMGIARNTAIKALYYTGNSNAELAATWIFDGGEEQPLAPALHGHGQPHSSGESDDEVVSYLEDGDFFKMVFVVNSELNMGVGKIAAQTAHATLALHRLMIDDQPRFGEMLMQWEQYGETKIVLKGQHTQQLLGLEAKATTLGLVNYLVHDAGKTQVDPGSITVLGIMGKNDLVNQVTGELSLL